MNVLLVKQLSEQEVDEIAKSVTDYGGFMDHQEFYKELMKAMLLNIGYPNEQT